MCYDEVGLCDESISNSIPDSTVNAIGRVYVIDDRLQGKRMFTLTSCSSCISAPIPKLKDDNLCDPFNLLQPQMPL